MTSWDLITTVCAVGFLVLVVLFIFWIAEKMCPTLPYKGLCSDGRSPRDLTTEELIKALSRGRYYLREWPDVMTELMLRIHKK